MKHAYVFPGQGAQAVGMGKDLYDNVPEAKALFEQANEILGFRITDIMFAGTPDELKQTKVTQPAVFLHSVILAKALGVGPDMVAGHSLGEFSALVVAGALSFEDGLRLVSKRALAMQAACEAQPGTIQILEKAIDVYRKGGNFPNMLRIMSRLGIYYHLSGEYEKAIATNQEAIATYNDSIAPGNVVIAYGEQANLYAELGMYDQALEMNKKAQYYSMLKDSFGLGDLYRYRAQIFRNMNQKDSVFHYLRLGEKLSMIQNSFKGVFVNKVETVNSYLDYPDSLEKALQLALSICPDTVRMPQWAKYQLNLHLGRALLQTGKEQNGIHLIDRAAQDLINMKFMEGRDANEILMDYYLAKGMNDDFARCYIRNRQFADSLDNNEKKRAVAAANIRFDTNQKEKENKLLSAQVQWQQQQLFYNICISITLLLLLITTTAYFIIRRKANHQLIENNKREIQTLIARQQGLNRRNEQLTEEIERAMATNNLNSIRQLTVQSLLSREDENTFRRSFATIHPSYLPKLRESYPQLTRNEELLAMLICMNQSTDEIALIMGINRNSVNVVRSRMRKNMELPKEKSLDEVLKQYLT